VPQTEPTATDQVRAAEVIASMCLATDLGMGFPFEHGFHATLTTMRLCEVLGVDEETVSRTYYGCLMMYVGCNVDGAEKTHVFGGNLSEHLTHRQFGSTAESLTAVIRALPSPGASLPRRVLQATTGLPRAARFRGGHFAAMCEVAGMLAERLGMPPSVHAMFPLLTERWDGSSVLKRASGDDIPLPLRIIVVGRDATYQRLIGDDEYVTSVIGSRAGHAFDPEVVAAFLENAADILGPREGSETMWDDVLAREPRPWLMLEGSSIDRALGAIGTFSDLVSPHLAGHCAGVSRLAAAAADLEGFEPAEIERVRRAALVHDVGRTAVGSQVWNKAGSLTADEREQVRLHPYHTDRVFARSPFLSELGAVAMAHHERLDGSGYHRGLDGSSLSRTARLLAVADAFQSKTESRPYRDSLSPQAATVVLVEKAKAGVLDPVMVRAVAEAAGEPPPTIERLAGLTERESEVLGLLARGLQTKQIARELDISAKTVDRHIQNGYRKIGVSSRAAATLFATEHGLVHR
jgi:HD-GYP domain-containing protein (c-di-GMP phosphodiesterase class II)